MTIKNQKEKPIKKLAVETINWRREVHQYHEPKPLSHLLWSSYFREHCFYSALVSQSICQHIMKRSLPMDRKAKIARQSRQSQQWQLLFRPLLLSAVPNHVSSAYTDSCFANLKKASTLIYNLQLSSPNYVCPLPFTSEQSIAPWWPGATSAPKKEVTLKPIDFQEI
jgi:hypothetical protein